MGKYKLTIKAVEDLSKIWEYTFKEWSATQADYYYNILLQNCQTIALSPEIGKNYEGITKALFGHHVNRHIIFYRKTNSQEVEITRILHEEMDISNRIKDK